MLLEKLWDGYHGLIPLISRYRKTAFTRGSKPIPLQIEQRRLSAAQYQEMANKKPAADIHLSPSCSECLRVINGSLFQCIQCEGKYYMCGSCVTCGKHPEHNIIVRATDSKVYFSDSLFLKC